MKNWLIYLISRKQRDDSSRFCYNFLIKSSQSKHNFLSHMFIMLSSMQSTLNSNSLNKASHQPLVMEKTDVGNVFEIADKLAKSKEGCIYVLLYVAIFVECGGKGKQVATCEK